MTQKSMMCREARCETADSEPAKRVLLAGSQGPPGHTSSLALPAGEPASPAGQFERSPMSSRLRYHPAVRAQGT
jgi:hypothetical protein